MLEGPNVLLQLGPVLGPGEDHVDRGVAEDEAVALGRGEGRRSGLGARPGRDLDALHRPHHRQRGP